jgi:hypothetical protein
VEFGNYLLAEEAEVWQNELQLTGPAAALVCGHDGKFGIPASRCGACVRGRPMNVMRWRLAALAAGALVLTAGNLPAADVRSAPDKKAKELVTSFGVLEGLTAEAARDQARDWLQEAGKLDANQKEFDAVWASDRTMVEKVGDTLALGDADAKKLLEDARNPATPAPTEVPALLKDAKKPAFFRSNLALAYGKALITRRVYEEGLESLKIAQAEQVVDPATYLFDRAVAEHALLLKDEANRTILRLLDDVVDAPERYKMVAALMHFDMTGWRDKDLGHVARMMDNIERRLDLYRGGPQTQDIQKKVVLRLDEMIKELEDQQCNCQGGKSAKNGKPSGKTVRPSGPAPEDYLGGIGGPGHVDPKKFKELAEVWGKLPDKDRAKAMLDLTRDMPARHRELVENYFKNLARTDTASK